jgi:hypothetical protein
VRPRHGRKSYKTDNELGSQSTGPGWRPAQFGWKKGVEESLFDCYGSLEGFAILAVSLTSTT